MMRRQQPRPALAAALGVALLGCALSTVACDNDQQTSPTPTVSQGSISVSPAGIGLAGATPYTFTATGFSSSKGEAVTYTWDFGDRTTATGGATITHTYMIDWFRFTVTVTATGASGATATASFQSIEVKSVTGEWGIRDSAGRWLLSSTFLTQNEDTLHGDNTGLNCRYAVTGLVAAPRSIIVTYVRPPGDCLGWNLPESFTFAGSADAAISSFTGTMTPGGSAVLVRCPSAGCF